MSALNAFKIEVSMIRKECKIQLEFATKLGNEKRKGL
jgi:hypothetical protein